MFRQESMYYLTGYDTFGYVFFQCLYLGADGTTTPLTRAPDPRRARHASVIEDIRVWVDAEDAEPARQLRAILDGHGCRGRRLGIEWEANGLTARPQRPKAGGGAGRLLRPRGRLRAGQPPARRQKPRRVGLRAPRRAPREARQIPWTAVTGGRFGR